MKKIIIIAVAALLLLLIGAGAAMYFLKLGPFAEPEVEEPPTAEELAAAGEPPRDPQTAQIGPVMVPLFVDGRPRGRLAFDIELILYTPAQRSQALDRWPHLQEIFLETLYGLEGPIDSPDDLPREQIKRELRKHARDVLGQKAVYDVAFDINITLPD